MLDAFLEASAAHDARREQRADLERQLSRLPDAVLHKIAEGAVLKTAYGYGDEPGAWLEKYKGTPLLDQAIALEREDLELQMEEQKRRQAEAELRAGLPTWEETSLRQQSLCIKRKMLDLELAGAGSGSPAAGGQEGEDLEGLLEEPAAAAPEPKPPAPKPPATEKVTKETTEKPPAEKVDIKTAAAAMRFTLALLQKEAQPANGASSFRR